MLTKILIPLRVQRFFVLTAFHGPEFVDWNRREYELRRWRTIAAKYSDLEAFVWVEEAPFLDQIETLIPVTIQSSLVTLVCMAIVSIYLLFILCNHS